MKITYLHASKFGNGAAVAAEFRRLMATRGVEVEVHHIRDVDPGALPGADLYVFSAPGRFGKPIRRMRRFLDRLRLPVGTPYGVLTTEMAPKPGAAPDPHQHVMPTMNEPLLRDGLVEIAEATIHVTGLKGPLEDGWERQVAAFAAAIAGVGQATAA